MSYGIELVRGKSRSKIKAVDSSSMPTGGTYCVSDPHMISESELSYNITYNFAWYFYETIDKELGIRWIYGKKAKDVAKRLESAKSKCEKMAEDEAKNRCILSETWGADEPYDQNRVDNDYWYPCAAHAAKAIDALLFLTDIAPNFTFYGD